MSIETAIIGSGVSPDWIIAIRPPAPLSPSGTAKSGTAATAAAGHPSGSCSRTVLPDRRGHAELEGDDPIEPDRRISRRFDESLPQARARLRRPAVAFDPCHPDRDRPLLVDQAGVEE